MGNGLSPCITPPRPRAPVELVFWGGAATELSAGQHLAGELMFRFPDRVVCRADSFYLGRPAPVLAIGDELLPGRTYFVLPIDRLPCHEYPLTAVSLAALSPAGPARASLASGAGGPSPFAYEKGSDGRLLIKVQPEFIKRLIGAAEVGDRCRGGEEGTTTLCSTPELRKHYEQLVGATRDRPWSPTLETISERKKRGISANRLSPVRLIGLEKKKTCFNSWFDA
ncbi:hypothetical protein Cni_G07808 [Canna indica]|uniref:Uncharacterized protein n=1 Tax=Canna indica TaxID=4628 RepID=A0AAQ3JZP5_9LILI|nr:hypothetical protein Cni_G07808 [Canna indica]